MKINLLDGLIKVGIIYTHLILNLTTMSDQQQGLTMEMVFESLGTAMTLLHQERKKKESGQQQLIDELGKSLKTTTSEKDAIIEDLKGTVKAKDEEIAKLHSDHDTAIGNMQSKFKEEKDAEIDALRKEKDGVIANLKKEIERINKQKDDANELCNEKNNEILKLERENCTMREEFDKYIKTQRALSQFPGESTD